MKIMKNFIVSKKDIEEIPVAVFTDEDGNDWYQSQSFFSKDTLKIMFDKEGLIVAASYDVSMLAPGGLSVAELDSSAFSDKLLDDLSLWVFDGENIKSRTYSASEKIKFAEEKRDSFISDARSVILEWQSELMLGSISDEDSSKLKIWLAYIKCLKAIDTSKPDDISWPQMPET